MSAGSRYFMKTNENAIADEVDSLPQACAHFKHKRKLL